MTKFIEFLFNGLIFVIKNLIMIIAVIHFFRGNQFEAMFFAVFHVGQMILFNTEAIKELSNERQKERLSRVVDGALREYLNSKKEEE